MRKTNIRFLIFLFALFLFLTVNRPAQAVPQHYHGGSWFGSAVLSVFYTPIKIPFAIVMAGVGSLSTPFTVPFDQTEVSVRIIKWGLFGDWLIQPKHLHGHEPLYFAGPDPQGKTNK